MASSRVRPLIFRRTRRNNKGMSTNAPASARDEQRALLADRLARTRARMEKMGVDAAIVRSTDRFLNEYVPEDESARVWLTGFTGSMGDALVTAEEAFLFVDGRYWIQADAQVDLDLWTVVKVRLGTGLDQALIDQLVAFGQERTKKLRVGFEPDRLTPRVLDRLKEATTAASASATWKPLFPSPVEAARGSERPAPKDPEIRALDESKVGPTVPEKLAVLERLLNACGAEALLVQRLDEIMWLTNLRGRELPHQATFKCIALATPERILVGIDPSKVPGSVRRAREGVLFMPEAELWTMVGRKAKRRRVAFDPANNTVQARGQLEKVGAQLIEVDAPLQPVRAKKSVSELRVMKAAFARADAVVEGVIAWVCAEVEKGERLTEASLAEAVEARFRESGALDLSFRVISAAGKNAAQIHYGEPNPRRVLKVGDLVLLDTGAYFEEGYATDLTRTFLVGGPKRSATDEQKRIYTLVLKAAIAGMRAVLPEGAKGVQLDALVRAPMWAEGLDYNHGTGHGVGINVHEFPPRVGPSSQTPLEIGHVFSIEPGYYKPSFGGVRIENLCTVVPGPKGFIRVEPLTFSPLDARLIDTRMLSSDEKSFLARYQRRPASPARAVKKGRTPTKRPATAKKAARRPRA